MPALLGAGRGVPDDVGAVSCHTVTILRSSPNLKSQGDMLEDCDWRAVGS